MHVAFNQTGQNGMPVQLHHAGIAAGVSRCALVAAHIQQTAIFYGQRGCVGIVVVHGVDVAAAVHHVGALIGGQGRCHAHDHTQDQHGGHKPPKVPFLHANTPLDI